MLDPLTNEYISKPDPKVRKKHLIDAARYAITSTLVGYW